VLLGYAFASLSAWISIPALVIETILAVSAIPIGGHHLVDVLAGLAVGAVSLAIAHAIAQAGRRERAESRGGRTNAADRLQALPLGPKN